MFFRAVWYRASHGKYFVQLPDRVQVSVSGRCDPSDAAKAEAQERADKILYDQLMRSPVLVRGRSVRTIAEAVRSFAELCERKVQAGRMGSDCYKQYGKALRPLLAEMGDRALSELTSEDFELWAARPAWSESTQHGRLGVVMSLLAHAGVALKIRRPPQQSRGAATCLTDEQFASVLANLYVRYGKPGDLRELFTFMRLTGMRPGEVRNLTVEGVDWPGSLIRLAKHKTRHKTGADRLVPLEGPALQLLGAQRDRYGSGVLFRTRGGKAYSINSIVLQCLAVSERVGFRVCAYGLGRHSYATGALERGVPEALVAALLGHKGTGMLERHYSHVTSRMDTLRAAARQAQGK